MEVVGAEELLNRLRARQLTIGSVTSDRSTALISMMRQRFPSIEHLRDPWHCIHGFYKRLRPVRSFIPPQRALIVIL